MATRIDQEALPASPGCLLLTDRGDPQRRRDGSNVQLNIKVTQATLDRVTRLVDANGWAFGEALYRVVAALERQMDVSRRAT